MATLPIKVSSGNLESYEALLLQFPEPGTTPAIDLVELNFADTSQVFPSAFALMAAYIGRACERARRPVVSRRFGANPLSAKLERAMDGFGFLPAVTGKGQVRSVPGVVPLIAITRDLAPESVAQRVLDVVLAVAQPTRDMKETMYVLVTEMVENVQLHAGSEAPAWLCGQLSAQRKKLELVLADAGVGVRRSLEQGSDAATAERVRGGESPVRVALELARSSRASGHTGFGLPLALEAVKLNRGVFRFTSGNETILASREGVKYRTHAAWPGTVVNFLFNLANTGPLADVYRALGPAVLEGEKFLDPAGADKAQGPAVALRGEGPYVGSRAAAARARAALLELVEAGQRAVADADGVAAMTPGFADELFGELLAVLGEPRFRESVAVKNANESTRLLVEAVLGRRVRPADTTPAGLAAAAAAAREAEEAARAAAAREAAQAAAAAAGHGGEARIETGDPAVPAVTASPAVEPDREELAGDDGEDDSEEE